MRLILIILISFDNILAFSPYSCVDSDGDCNLYLINQTDDNFEIVDLLTYPFGYLISFFNISLQEQEEIDDALITIRWYTDVGFGASNINIDYWNGSSWINCISGLNETAVTRQDECNITSLTKNQTTNIIARIRGEDNDGMPNAFLYVDSVLLKLNYSSPPLWRNQYSSSEYIFSDQSINLSVELFDDVGLSYTWLETNETGYWQNYSFISLNGINNSWINVNFTWSNLKSGFIYWRVNFNDTTGKENSTDFMSFFVQFRRLPLYCVDSDGDCDFQNINKSDNVFESVDLLTYPYGWIEINLWNYNISLDKEIKNSITVIEWYADVEFGASNINIDYWNGSSWINCANPTVSSILTTSYCNMELDDVESFNNVKIRIRGEDNDGMPNAFLYVDNIYILSNFTEDSSPPKYFLNQTNSTRAGREILFSVFWKDNINLTNGKWQGWIDNCTGHFVNVTSINVFTNSSEWTNFTATINETKGCTIRWFVNASDNKNNWNNTAFFHPFEFNTTSSAYLEVKLVKPPGNFNIAQNKTFFINATVFCREDDCGIVNATIRYNSSSLEPNAPISEVYGDTPLFINESIPMSTKECLYLSRDQFCNITWIINASGNLQTSWTIGVLFMSESIENHTNNVSLTIYECAIDLLLSWNEIKFDDLLPNTFGNEALGNSENFYNITLVSGSCDSNIWIKSTDLIGSSVIKAGNITWGLQRNYTNSTRMENEFKLLKENVKQNDIITTFYWIDAPIIYAGKYSGNITILANETGG